MESSGGRNYVRLLEAVQKKIEKKKYIGESAKGNGKTFLPAEKKRGKFDGREQ